MPRFFIIYEDDGENGPAKKRMEKNRDSAMAYQFSLSSILLYNLFFVGYNGFVELLAPFNRNGTLFHFQIATRIYFQ